MMKNILTILLATFPLFISCTEVPLTVYDNKLDVRMEVLTPSVGNGGVFSARLFTSHKEIVISNLKCDYRVFADDKEVVGSTSLSLFRDYLTITTEAITSESDMTITISFNVSEKVHGQVQEISCDFTVNKNLVVSPRSITPDRSEILLISGSSSEGKATVNLLFDPDDCNKEYLIDFDSAGWEDLFSISTDGQSIVFDATQKSKAGNVTLTITSACNPFVSCTITVKVRIDVALVLDGTSTGNKSRLSWNQYESYLFSKLYCYVAIIHGDIRHVMESATKDSSSLTFSTVQSSFDYDIEFVLKRLQGSSLNSLRFPYRCLSNANMALNEIRSRINSETDRKNCDSDTGYQYYTLMVNRMSYKSDIYRIRYIVHRYKTSNGGSWVACPTLSGEYKKEKNKYWYAAADTDQWIIEWEGKK